MLPTADPNVLSFHPGASVLYRLLPRSSFKENCIDLLNDRHLHFIFLCKLYGCLCRIDTFHNHLHFIHRLLHRPSLTDQITCFPIPAVHTCTSYNQSPIPVSPVKLSIFPPIFTPWRAISAIPSRDQSSFVLSPYPSPSAIPAASAMTFFSEPPSSIPRISGLV